MCRFYTKEKNQSTFPSSRCDVDSLLLSFSVCCQQSCSLYESGPASLNAVCLSLSLTKGFTLNVEQHRKRHMGREGVRDTFQKSWSSTRNEAFLTHWAQLPQITNHCKLQTVLPTCVHVASGLCGGHFFYTVAFNLFAVSSIYYVN